MRVVLASLGTDGDIFPYVALGAALRSRGHPITLAAGEHYRSLAAQHGFAFQSLISDQENHDLLGHPDFWHPLKTVLHSARWGVRLIQRNYDLLAGLAGPDTMFIANPAILGARFVHERTGIPLANLILQPGMIPSSIAPPVMPGVPLPAWAPRPAWKLFWRVLDGVGDVLVGRESNRVRASIGLPPMRRLFSNWLSPQLVLGMFPEWYGPPQADWPRQLRLTGFPLHDGQTSPELPPEVLNFCRSGPPPIVFTFGTGMMHARELFHSAVEACQTIGTRGLLLTKYRHQLPPSLPPSVLHCEFAPFEKLLPLCAAVAHHGGIGTTARAMSAGIPQLILPFAFDQMDNAARVKRLGVGASLKGRGKTPASIARALRQLMTSENRARCGEIARRFEGKDSTSVAVQQIEALANRRL